MALPLFPSLALPVPFRLLNRSVVLARHRLKYLDEGIYEITAYVETSLYANLHSASLQALKSFPLRLWIWAAGQRWQRQNPA
jgi:hypothetical protein